MRQMRLHTEAFEHRCLYPKKTLHRDTLTYTRLYTHKLLQTEFFQRITEALTQRSLYTKSFTHRSIYTQRVFHRSFYTEKLLRTGAFTHKRLYTQKLVHTEAFTHRSSYTEKPLHRAAFTRFKIANLLGFWCSAIMSCERVTSGVLTLDNHFASKGCAWPWKLVIYTRFIWHDTVVPDVSKWIKSHFYT